MLPSVSVGGATVTKNVAINELTEMPGSEAVANGSHALIVATRRYVGEGFDARLDTLFPTMPISWQGLRRNPLAVSAASTMRSEK